MYKLSFKIYHILDCPECPVLHGSKIETNHYRFYSNAQEAAEFIDGFYKYNKDNGQFIQIDNWEKVED